MSCSSVPQASTVTDSTSSLRDWPGTATRRRRRARRHRRVRGSRLVIDRLDRQQSFARLGALGEERVHKALWNLYRRGNAQVRQRIEAELEPGAATSRRRGPEPVDPLAVLDEVRRFVGLARSGAYLAGDRRVRPQE